MTSSCAHTAGAKPATVSRAVPRFHFTQTTEKNLEDILIDYKKKKCINEPDVKDRYHLSVFKGLTSTRQPLISE